MGCRKDALYGGQGFLWELWRESRVDDLVCFFTDPLGRIMSPFCRVTSAFFPAPPPMMAMSCSFGSRRPVRAKAGGTAHFLSCQEEFSNLWAAERMPNMGPGLPLGALEGESGG